jgi:hypothetical protein
MKYRLPHRFSVEPASWCRPLLACLAILMGCVPVLAQTPIVPAKHFAKPERIRYDGECFTIDGRDMFIRSAAFQYFRTPREVCGGFFFCKSIRKIGRGRVFMGDSVRNSPVDKAGALTVTVSEDGAVRLDWKNASGTSQTGVKVEASIGCAPFHEIADLAAGACRFENTGIERPQAVRYRIRAYSNGGCSACSNIAKSEK